MFDFTRPQPSLFHTHCLLLSASHLHHHRIDAFQPHPLWPSQDHPKLIAKSRPTHRLSLIRLAPLTAPASRGWVQDPLTVVERTLLYIGSLFVRFPLSFRLSRHVLLVGPLSLDL